MLLAAGSGDGERPGCPERTFETGRGTVKIVRSIQRHRELRKLRERIEANPRAQDYVLLAERLLASKTPDEVLPVVREGLTRFPWSERLQVLAFRLGKSIVRRELEDLEASIARSPSPEIFGRLAEIHRRIGDEEEAIRVCRECAARFPQNENGFLVEGRLRLDRFARTGQVRDALLAVEKLERAAVLNPENMRARRLLADFFFDVGARNRARTHIDAILAHASGDAAIREMDEILRELEETSPSVCEDENLEELLRLRRTGQDADTESVGSVTSTVDTDFGPVPCLEGLRDELERLPGVLQIVQQVYLAPDGGEPGGHDEPEEFVTTARSLTRLAQESLVEMDMGNFRHGQVSGDWGHVLFFRIGSWLIAASAGSQATPADIRRSVLSVPSTGAVPVVAR